MMDPCTYKHYHVHGYNSRQFLEQYLSDKPDMPFREDALIFPIDILKKIFAKGHIKGFVLIDCSLGSVVHHLLAPSEFFKHIIVLKVKDRCILELKRWLNARTGAFDWAHATELHDGSSDPSGGREEKVRSTVQHVMRCDIGKPNMMDPIALPPADCMISVWLLDVICKDHDEYKHYLKKFSDMLKLGGHIILIGCLEKTHYIVGEDRLFALKYDEAFARKALVETGFVIDECVVKKRTAVSPLTDYQALICIVAHKEK